MAGPPSGASAAPPSIVILLADDLSYGDIGVHGTADAPTPLIDKLAAQGVRFTDAYATSPVCGPSRAGLISGRYPSRIGVSRNKDVLPAAVKTIGEVFQSAGYRTALFGKWHLGEGPLNANRRGFEEFDGFHYRAEKYEDKVGEFLPHFFTRKSLDFIRQEDARPFLIIVSFSDPDTPIRPPAKYLERIEHALSPLRRGYLGLVMALDEAVGTIMSGLEEAGLEEETLVVFANDNGGPGVSDRCAAKNTSSNTPLRGFKQELYEGGIRVPLIMRWTDTLPVRVTFEEPVTLMDLLPTAASPAQVEVRTPLDGVDLLPHLLETPAEPAHPQLFWTHHGDLAIREGPWKLLLVQDSAPQLFNLARDQSETTNLAAAEPARARSNATCSRGLIARSSTPNGPARGVSRHHPPERSSAVTVPRRSGSMSPARAGRTPSCSTTEI